MLDMLSHLMDILAPTLRPVSRSQSEPVSGLLLHTAPFLRSGLLCYYYYCIRLFLLFHLKTWADVF